MVQTPGSIRNTRAVHTSRCLSRHVHLLPRNLVHDSNGHLPPILPIRMARRSLLHLHSLLVCEMDILALEHYPRRYWRYGDDAYYILRERYARGEITKEQFEQMMRDLQQHSQS